MSDVTTHHHQHDLPRRYASHAIESDLPLPQLVTPEEAAHYLGVSPYTVGERLKSGEIPGRKHGSRWLIRVVDLTAYVEPNNTH